MRWAAICSCPRPSALAHRALGREGVQRRRKQVPRPVLVVDRFFVHSVPGLPQPGQNFRLPWLPLAQQKEGRCTRLQQRVDELLPEDGVHAADEPRMEHPGCSSAPLSAASTAWSTPELINTPCLVRKTSRALLTSTASGLLGKDVFKLFMPMPCYRVACKVLFIAGNRKQCAAVLHQFPALVIRHNIRQAVEPARCCTAGLKCHDRHLLSVKVHIRIRAGFVVSKGRFSS